jgi:hypothetical protein
MDRTGVVVYGPTCHGKDGVKRMHYAALVAVCGGLLGGCGTVDADDADASAVDANGLIDAGVDLDAARVWSPFEEVSVAFSSGIMMPQVSADGLTLYFVLESRQSPLDFDVYFATRSPTDSGFGAPAPLPGLSNPDVEERYVEFSADGLDAFFCDRESIVHHASRRNTDEAFGPPASTGLKGYYPSISGDRRSLYYVALVNNFEGKVMRITRAAPGAPWSVPSQVTVPAYVDIFGGIDISQDELSIVIAPSWGNPDRPGDVVVGRRSSLVSNFSDFSTVAVATDGFYFNSVRWGTGDAEIWVHQYNGTIDRPFVARLR